MGSSVDPRPGEEGSAAPGQVERWIAEAQAGSRSALGRALEAARNYLLTAANRAMDVDLRSKAGGSDLVQETFTEAQQGFGRFRGTTEEEFYAWLNTILAHRVAHHVRRYRQTQKRSVDRELPPEAMAAVLAGLTDDAPTPGTVAIDREQQGRIRNALAKLDEIERWVLMERTWQRKSFAEIGQMHGCAAEEARKLWARALDALHRAFGEGSGE